MANENSTDIMHRFIRCAVGEETYCLNLAAVASLERVDRLQHHFGASPLVGWLPVADTRVPVYSLAGRLNRPQSVAQVDNRIIIVNVESSMYGLLVDQVSDPFETTDKEIKSLPKVLADAANYFEGVVWADEQLLLCLAPDRLHQEASANSIFSSTVELFPESHRAAVGSVAVPKGRGQILMFAPAKKAGEAYTLALSLTQVMEILELTPLVPVPGAPDYVLGLANWRRNVVPVIDLNSRFGFTVALEVKALAKSECRLLIARASTSSQLCGFLIQPNPKTHSLPIPHEPCQNEFPVPRILVRGVFELENEVLVLPDLDRMIA